MRRRTIALWIALLLIPCRPVSAFNQPPLNLGLTSLLDGGPVLPGAYLLEYAQISNGKKAVDHNGDDIPGGAQVNVVVNLHQLFFLSPIKLFGGFLGMDFVLPVVGVSAKGSLGAVPMSANTSGLGDLALGPVLQWNEGTLLGRPFFQRVELGITVPTGKYEPAIPVNPGANLLTIEPYYSFSWMFAQDWATSWRIFYALHGENDRTKVRPGQAFHFNYAFSRAVHPKLRLGASGYFLQQTTEDKTAGVSGTNSKERAISLGSALAYIGKGLILFLSHPVELHARNRFKSSRTTLQLIHRF